jgi:glycosyltransferase involved in cell wall biosynthesis
MTSISVIICCYNSEHRIGSTLESLLAQRFKNAVSWEVVLVDNNCSDQTVEVAQSVWGSDAVPLRVVQEATPGLSAARDRGVAESVGEYILFCDDDNWLAPDYLQRAFTFMEASLEYAAIGGWGDVVSDEEVAIPEWFDQFKTKYACGKTNDEGDVDTLVGAGMFLRKEALLNLKQSGFKSLLSDRKGAALSSGGDLELCMALRIAGWKLHFSENLYFQHYMPAGRLTEDYLLRMSEGHGRSRSILGEYRSTLAGSVRKSRWFYGLGFRFRLLLRVLKFRVLGLKLTPDVPLVQRVEHATNTGSAASDSECLGSGQVGNAADHLWQTFECLRMLRERK